MNGESVSPLTRRRLLQLGGTAAGAAVLLAAGGGQAGAIAPTDTPPDGGFLSDGAPSTDPDFGGRPGVASPNAAGVLRSYNGWPIGTPGSTIGIKTYPIPGSTVKMDIKSGDVSTVFVYLAQRYNAEVEKLIAGQSGGYEYRKNVNDPSTWSNHASGTAMDFNWEKHPNGSQGTFTSLQLSNLRNVLAYFGDVIYWGGDYRGTIDEMHFEINLPPGDPQLVALAARIKAKTVAPPRASLWSWSNNGWVSADDLGKKRLVANRASVGDWEAFDLISQGHGNVALRARINHRYVSADNAGTGSLIANRTSVGVWETFTMNTSSGGNTTLLAHANNRYVTVRGDGSLIASSTSVDDPQTFRLALS